MLSARGQPLLGHVVFSSPRARYSSDLKVYLINWICNSSVNVFNSRCIVLNVHLLVYFMCLMVVGRWADKIHMFPLE